MFLVKLRRILQFNNLINKLYLIVIGLILLLIAIIRFNYLTLIICIIYFILLMFIHFKVFILLVIISFIISSNVLFRHLHYLNNKTKNILIKCRVVEVIENEQNYKVTVKSKGLKYICYLDDIVYLGDVLLIEGDLLATDINHSEYLFNYKRYLKDNNILGIINVNNIRFIKKSFSIYKLNEYANNYFNNHFEGETLGYVKALLIGSKENLSNNFTKNISQIGIGHLFVISGLHMNVLQQIILKIIKLIRIKEKYHFIIITTFFVLYFLITHGLISILRVLSIYILSHINKTKKIGFSNLDIYMAVIILLLLINPYYLFDYGFVLTFLISSFLVVINPLIRYTGFLGNILNNIIISINSILVTLPIIININPTINILSILYNLIYIPFVSYILLPLSIVITVLPLLSSVYGFIVHYFSYFTSILSNIKIGKILFSLNYKLGPYIYYLLYVLFLYLLINKKNHLIKIVIKLFIFHLFIWNNIIIIDSYDEIVFLDLPIGESTLIKKSHNQANILIDTGENKGDDLELYLKKHGIKKIDYVFITHSDSDHNGKLSMLIDNFKIDNIVINKYDLTSKKIVLSSNYKNKLILAKRNDTFSIKGIKIKILLPDIDTFDSNNNSLVMHVNAFNHTFLFTGDIEKEQERRLSELVDKIKVDFLKIPHHASLTSSSDYLLKLVDYKYAIAMSGYKNTHGFPNSVVLSRYDKDKLYLTKDKNTIVFKKRWYNKLLKYK